MQTKLWILHAEKTDQIKRPWETCQQKGQPPIILHLSPSPMAVPFRFSWVCGCPQLPEDSYVSSPMLLLAKGRQPPWALISLYLCAGHSYQPLTLDIIMTKKTGVCHAFRLQCQPMMALSITDTLNYNAA